MLRKILRKPQPMLRKLRKNGFLNKQHEANKKLLLYFRAFPLNSYFKIGSGFFLR